MCHLIDLSSREARSNIARLLHSEFEDLLQLFKFPEAEGRALNQKKEITDAYHLLLARLTCEHTEGRPRNDYGVNIHMEVSTLSQKRDGFDLIG